MSAVTRRRPGTDPLLLVEAALVLLLLILFLFLYVVPTERRLQGVPWSSPIILAVLFLVVLIVDSRRRKRRSRREMEAMMDNHRTQQP